MNRSRIGNDERSRELDQYKEYQNGSKQSQIDSTEPCYFLHHCHTQRKGQARREATLPAPPCWAVATLFLRVVLLIEEACD